MSYSFLTINCFKQLIVTMIGVLVVTQGYAHQSPTTMAVMDISPRLLALELQLPLSELSLAMGQNLEESPETLLQTKKEELETYVLKHVHAYVDPKQPWRVSITDMHLDQEKDAISGRPIRELNVSLVLSPKQGENTRRFTLDYDLIMHRVGNHVAFVSIRNDWEKGRLQNKPSEIGIIRVDTEDNRIYPLEIHLEKGDGVQGFMGMVSYGMQHIKEGTDHLLFILTLLLPACLLVRNEKWAGYGGIKYSLTKLLKIITAFTLGHSLTLLIGTLGIQDFPVQWIEVLIAVSIFISAIHAVKPLFYNKELWIATGFGLIHGLAFSQTLYHFNLDSYELFLSVLGFNLGIEFMQLMVIVITVPAFIMLSQTTVFGYVRNFLAGLIMVVALGWIMERISEQPNSVTQLVDLIYPYSHYLLLGLYLISILSLIISLNRQPSKNEASV
ncbi:HupE/UreJ protein [Dyadobacter jejuensis]|uniref:HupE/UreJ protein n=1 Tax=Dyadobacter jejuensis TaxID=1082580 RepID=A0A316APB1_9BACT|nr:HupE/UreJ family protein [Dyadobacter jejuensis]PWJ59318.1 HupE/UreJ protein [Dyadobacter jejuensis]